MTFELDEPIYFEADKKEQSVDKMLSIFDLIKSQVKANVKVNDEEGSKVFKAKFEKKIDTIDHTIHCIDDLIELGKLCEQDDFDAKNYSVDIHALHGMTEALERLRSMIGMDDIKTKIIQQVMYYLQSLHHGEGDLLHTVIKGPPGVGKTELGHILSKIYLSLGITTKDRLNVVKRSDLIGEYLGHTAKKTQRAIDDAMGGVLFIDEAYSLGSMKQNDSYSKECLDTLNQNLSERKGKFICIIAGYEESLDTCFFATNPGLRRRFNFEYTIKDYDSKQMGEILLKKMSEAEWDTEQVCTRIRSGEFIEKNKQMFKYFGGDMERWFTKIKIAYSQRMFGKRISKKKTLEWVDVSEGFKLFNTTVKKDATFYNYYI